MLRDRLWMGAVLVLLVIGALVADQWLAPWYPVLFLLLTVLSLGACIELRRLLGPDRAPPLGLALLAILAMLIANWAAHIPNIPSSFTNPWSWIVGTYLAIVLFGFCWAMATFDPASGGKRLTQLAFLLFLTTYFGLLPSCLAQMRWPSVIRAADRNLQAVLGMALTIFVPKCCDIGAYTFGRLFGRHKMAPVLSPGKTWQGVIGGLGVAMAAAVGINALGPALPGPWWVALGFGLTVGIAGILGDLAESLIKRECKQKDAGQSVPGFGGVMDVVDSILFAAPVAYPWLYWAWA